MSPQTWADPFGEVAVDTPIRTGLSEADSHSRASDSNHGDGLPLSAVDRRVLHVINGEDYAGAERVQDLLAARLPDFGYRVGFACVKPGKFAERRHARQAPLVEARTRTALGLGVAWRLSQLVREEGYDLIHAHTPRSAIVAYWVARLTGRPWVYHVHSPASRDSTRPVQNWVNAHAERFFVRGAARLIAVSHSLSRHMIEAGFNERKLRTVYNGVPSGPEPANRPRPQGIWTLGMIALFRPRKGTEVLLQAMRWLLDRGHNVQLKCIGGFQSADYERELKGLSQELGVADRVTWAGFCSDVPAQLRELDLLVLPSLFGEGLPMVVLEAMAAGVPVVGTRVEGVPEALREGVDGILADPGDSHDLAVKLQTMITGDVSWHQLRESARLRQTSLFSDVSMARGVAGVYGELIRTKV